MLVAKKRVAVVIHEHDRKFDLGRYFISLIVREWEARGWTVHIVRGVQRFIPADVAIAHIDLTKVPQAYVEFLSRYPVVVNSALYDISKSRLSSLQVRDAADWPGQIIVKTDLNCGGTPEADIAAASGSLASKLASVRRRITRRFRPSSEYGHLYQIYDSYEDVPRSVRNNREYVLEKFVPERDGDLYVVHLWTFLGSRGVASQIRSTEPVVKSRGFVDAGITETPAGIAEKVRALGADYGKVDFVLHDGEPVIFDVNRTPTYAAPPNERHLMIARELAPALDEFI